MNSSWGTSSFTGGQLTIDLGALAENFRDLQARAAPAEAAAVVKADAYGLGVEPVVGTLCSAGCRHFFVAQLSEAMVVRPLAPEAEVYVLNGLWPGAEQVAETARLVPVLSTLDQLERWRDLAAARGKRLPAVIQIDTGMSRLGLTPDEVDWLAGHPEIFRELDVRYLMTHLACADAPEAAANEQQRAAFLEAAARVPSTPLSLANSAATLSDAPLGGDLVRIGVALYGGGALTKAPNPMRPVVRLTGRVIQLRTVADGTGVGYGLTYRAYGARRLATVSIGYADGVPRRLAARGAAFFGAERLPVVGRISMDSLVVDVTSVAKGALGPGDSVELIGPHQTLDQIAALADTIPYEILVNLSRRAARRYIRPGPAA